MKASDEDDRTQLNKFLRQAGTQNKVLEGLFSARPLTFNHKAPQQVSYLLILGVGMSETSKKSCKVGYITQIMAQLQTVGKNRNQDINLFPVTGSPILPGPAASWLIQELIHQFISCKHCSQRANELVLAPFRHPQWLISSGEHSNKSSSTANISIRGPAVSTRKVSLKLRSFSTCCKMLHTKGKKPSELKCEAIRFHLRRLAPMDFQLETEERCANIYETAIKQLSICTDFI